ncbi:NAD(P)-dependent dehydrogenase (short-subunit alcohol dehydrogenase family) [Asanoa ferruginea]|uniref:NAD(P)-dependent dehydrogenase (Short-subunit alcohol dehydrogenase family) n=1 Tax=Asanoa ferruginea TaxID=53367 RepID=A0A3D9ZDV1_9ACTN|nr:SDR family oxidoreductase [Asanoa ferruginea]REF94684.1 NAD(P)-dependent dehydrogenase (short-subunit alcohol dehydrogenase family) [Asanoa ferruginea]GIF45738.1 short-chain dehydrogenase [Asanoa ferruginea]
MLDGKRVLVVGGTSGLGLRVAQAVAEAGATPIVASRNKENIDRALGTLPDRATGAPVDLTDPESVARLITFAGPIDHLVYTAGEPLRLTMLAELTPEVARSFWETRYFGALSVVRAAIGAGAIRDGGSVVLTGGNAGQRPAPGWALGASICGALDALTRQLALELAPVRVNLVAPGVTRSPLWAAMAPSDERAMYDGLAAKLPVGRVGETSDVARAYVYAMEQSMATGTSILVDGGAVLV